MDKYLIRKNYKLFDDFEKFSNTECIPSYEEYEGDVYVTVDNDVPPINDDYPPINDNNPPIDDDYPPIDDNFTPIDDNFPPIDDNFPPIDDDYPPMREQKPCCNNSYDYYGLPLKTCLPENSFSEVVMKKEKIVNESKTFTFNFNDNPIHISGIYYYTDETDQGLTFTFKWSWSTIQTTAVTKF